jgi:hypothetical protein
VEVSTLASYVLSTQTFQVSMVFASWLLLFLWNYVEDDDDDDVVMMKDEEAFSDPERWDPW